MSKALKSQSILSRHLSKIRSSICPLQLPYHTEILAQAYNAAPSPSSSPVKPSVNRDAKIYLDIFAEVDNMVLSSDSDSENGWIKATSDDSMSC